MSAISEMAESVIGACRFVHSTENYVTITAFTIIFLLSVMGNAVVIAVVVQVKNMGKMIAISIVPTFFNDRCAKCFVPHDMIKFDVYF